MPSLDPEYLLQQLKSFDQDTIASLPETFKSRLYTATRKCMSTLESPTETVARLLLTQPTEAIHVRVATDIHLFKALGKKALLISEIAQATGADPKLLDYLLRGLQAFGVVEQDRQQKFKASSQYALFQDEKFENAFPGCQDFLQKVLVSWPAFLRSNGYQCPQEATDTAVQHAFGTKGMCFREIFENDPEHVQLLRDISVLMFVWAEGFTQVQDLYPVEERLIDGFDPAAAMFVDVGGNFGQKAIALKKALPGLPGKFVVQDLPQVIEKAPKNDTLFEEIEMMAHDFFTEQPIKGARCYYIRQTLHNWQDAHVIEILQRLRDAGKPGYSRILIHEIIVSDKDAKPWVACQDLTMLSIFALGERTEADWQAVCNEAGLKVSKIYTNDNPNSEGVIELEI